MKKYLLHLSLPVLLFSFTLTACNQKEFPGNNNEMREEISTSKTAAYAPPQVITISDDKARTNKDGEMYYDDEYGYRYWRSADGKYYLDVKYFYGAKPNTKQASKRNKIPEKKNLRNTEASDLAHQ